MRNKLPKVCKFVLLLIPSAHPFIKHSAIADSVRRRSSQRPMARFRSLAMSGVIRVAWIAVLSLLMLAIPVTNRAQSPNFQLSIFSC